MKPQTETAAAVSIGELPLAIAMLAEHVTKDEIVAFAWELALYDARLLFPHAADHSALACNTILRSLNARRSRRGEMALSETFCADVRSRLGVDSK